MNEAYIRSLVRPNISSLRPYVSARHERPGTEGIFLDANENPYGALNRYPDAGQTLLRQRLAELRNINPAQVFTGNGSDEPIDLLLRIFCRPGTDKAMTFVPTYGMYEVAAAINGVTLLEIPLDKDFQLPAQWPEAICTDPLLKLAFVCSPNNPTGNSLHHIGSLLERFRGIVVVDEAYIDFAGEASLTGLLDRYPNLVVLQTLSKAWGLAGIRIGMAFASEQIIQLLDKVRPPYNISTLNQQAALDALADPALFENRRQKILEQRSWLQTELARLAIIKKVYPSDANFLLAETPDATQVYRQLAAQQVIVRNRGQAIPGCIRITVGSPEENRRLIAALQNIKIK